MENGTLIIVKREQLFYNGYKKIIPGDVYMYLAKYDIEFKSFIDAYTLSEEQLQFTGTPRDAIQLSATDRDRHSILAIEDDRLVTFFVLHEQEGPKPYSQNPYALLVRAFSTDYHHQGKGFAKQSLLLLPSFVQEHFPHINEIVLAVNVRNTAAQHLYKACGFLDEGVRTMGKKGELVVMSYYLEVLV